MSGNKTLSLSVRDMVEFSARCGDLSQNQDGPTTLEGIRGHQKIQNSRDSKWQKEVPLSFLFRQKDYSVNLQGRVDLLYEDFVSCVVEELKTTYYPPNQIPEEKRNLHKAQARVYACLYSLTHPEHAIIDVRITWFDLVRQKTHSESEQREAIELKNYTEDLLAEYLSWFSAVEKKWAVTRSSAQQLRFPFESFRGHQRNFSSLVYQSIREKNDLLIEAPTGAGKTIATVFPSIKALGQGLSCQIAYLTLKNSAATMAEDALALLARGGLSIMSTRIQAKDKTCPCRQANRADELLNEDGVCRKTVGYFDRLPRARVEALSTGIVNTETLQRIAEKHDICPFAFSLELARWSSFVICDVNYVFDPMIRQSFFDSNSQSRTLLIDEIHNLVARGREMYSADLETRDLKFLDRQVRPLNATASKILRQLIESIEAISKTAVDLRVPPDNITTLVAELMTEVNSPSFEPARRAIFSEGGEKSSANILLALYKFKVIIELYSEAHITLYEPAHETASLRLFCRDPASHLQKICIDTRSTIGFSATLTPIDYFKNTLGFTKETPAFSLPSTFPVERQLTLRCDYINTRWQQREHSLDKLVALIFTLQKVRRGNYIVFLPSYAYLDIAHASFTCQHPDIQTVVQPRSANESDRTAFINAFLSSKCGTHKDSLVGFAILGGVFGEGVDFIGEALHGAVVVGLGMPQPAREQKVMEAYYQAQGLNSFHYVYQFPGLHRVLQTSGRVIRSEHDKGVVVLVDPRMQLPEFNALLPPHWRPTSVKSEAEIEKKLQTFWHAEQPETQD